MNETPSHCPVVTPSSLYLKGHDFEFLNCLVKLSSYPGSWPLGRR